MYITLGWLLVLGLKEGLVECATVCVKSVVILKKVASEANTQWDAGCSLTSKEFEKKKTDCADLGYQVFHVHKHTNRFIKR